MKLYFNLLHYNYEREICLLKSKYRLWLLRANFWWEYFNTKEFLLQENGENYIGAL
jgi:hypothetical protein